MQVFCIMQKLGRTELHLEILLWRSLWEAQASMEMASCHLSFTSSSSEPERQVQRSARQSLLTQSSCPLSDPGDGPLGGSCLRLRPARAPAGPPRDAGQPHECPQPVPAHLPDGHPEWHRPQLPITPREQVSDSLSIQFHTGGGVRCPFQGA